MEPDLLVSARRPAWATRRVTSALNHSVEPGLAALGALLIHYGLRLILLLTSYEKLVHIKP